MAWGRGGDRSSIKLSWRGPPLPSGSRNIYIVLQLEVPEKYRRNGRVSLSGGGGAREPQAPPPPNVRVPIANALPVAIPRQWRGKIEPPRQPPQTKSWIRHWSSTTDSATAHPMYRQPRRMSITDLCSPSCKVAPLKRRFQRIQEGGKREKVIRIGPNPRSKLKTHVFSVGYAKHLLRESYRATSSRF